MMKRSLILVLSLLMLVLWIPALAESTDWNYDANYAILRGYDGAGGDVVVPAEIDGFTVDVIGVSVFKGDMLSLARLEGDHEEGMVDKLSKAGRIGDPEALEAATKLLALRVVQGIGDKVLAVIVLIAALIAVRRMDRKRGPQPRREKKRYAV